jgi:hypothetical protein
MDVQDHVAGLVTDAGIRMGSSVIEETNESLCLSRSEGPRATIMVLSTARA